MEKLLDFHEIVSIEVWKLKENTIKISKYKSALELIYKFGTDSGRKLLCVIENNFNYFQISFYATYLENIKEKVTYRRVFVS